MRRFPLAGFLRRVAACALLAVTLGGNFASHHHSLFSLDEEAGRDEERVVTRHNPLSHASHWHAVLAFVHDHECVACHNQRLAGLPIQGHETAPAVSTQGTLPIWFAAAPAAPLVSTSSRAPPILV
jgi:hypothetical protein